MSLKYDILKTAQSKINIVEGENNPKYREIIDTYNSIRPLPRGYKAPYNVSWCCIFISYIFYLNKALYLLEGGECGCEELLKKIKGKYNTDKDKAAEGSLVFYDWKGNNWSDHIGIIESRTYNTIVVIEGNKSDKVDRRTINIDDKSIRAIVNIDYKEEEKDTEDIVKLLRDINSTLSKIIELLGE